MNNVKERIKIFSGAQLKYIAFRDYEEKSVNMILL